MMLASVSVIADDLRTIRVGGSAESIYDTRIADVEILISLFFNEMFKDQDKQLKIKIYDTDQMLSAQLAAGKLDAVFMNPVFYLDNIDHLNYEFTYGVRHGSTIKARYVVLVRRDSGITNLADLRNKKIIIPSGHTVGQRFLDVELMRAGLSDTEDIFSELHHTRETNAAIVNLFFGHVDAALVTDFSYQVASELNRQIPDTLHIILSSQPLIHMLVSVRKEFPPHLVDQFIPFTQVFDTNPRLQYLRKTFLFEGVTKVTTEDISDIDKLNREYNALKKERVAR